MADGRRDAGKKSVRNCRLAGSGKKALESADGGILLLDVRSVVFDAKYRARPAKGRAGKAATGWNRHFIFCRSCSFPDRPAG